MESALPASASPSEGRPPAPRFLSHGMVAARPFALAAAVVCAGLAFGAPARAADTAKDPVVATVDGEEIRRSEVDARSEEHTSELQSLMRISYAVFCLKKKTNKK